MRIWRLIAHHENPHGAIDRMKELNRIAIGWSDIGDLQQLGIDGPSSISKLITVAYPKLDNAHLGGPSLWNLYQNMEIGDLVIVNANSSRNCVFEIIGPYIFEDNEQDIFGYSHQRPASLTNLEADELWVRAGSNVAPGQNIRWTLAGCSETTAANEAILKEGMRFSVVSTAIERNPEARRKCLEHYGCKCFVCAFEFKLKYGELGGNYIHVHHRTDISLSNGEYRVDPILDLIPLCPNCHAMVHQQKPSMSVEKLKEIYESQNA